MFAGRYQLKKRLGSGGFSEVWLVSNLTANIKQALKVYIGLDEDGIDIFRREFTRVHGLNHPNLLKASDFDIYEDHPFLIMPYCANGSLGNQIGKMDERRLAHLLRDISSALGFLQLPKVGIIHQDIKPDNFLIADNGDYLLADFGISTALRRNLSEQDLVNASEAVGVTPSAYRAPELFDRDHDMPVHATDIWALGAAIYELACGHTPFGQLGGSLQSDDSDIPELSGDFSPGFKKLIQQCLRKNTWDRIGAGRIHRLSNEFLQTGQWSPELFSAASSSIPNIPTNVPTPSPGSVMNREDPPGVRTIKPEGRSSQDWSSPKPKPAKPLPGRKKNTLVRVAFFLPLLAVAGLGYFMIVDSAPKTNPTIINTTGLNISDNPDRDTLSDDQNLVNSQLSGVVSPTTTESNELSQEPTKKETPKNSDRNSPDRKNSGRPKPVSDYTTYVNGKNLFIENAPYQSGVSCNIRIDKVQFRDRQTQLYMSFIDCGADAENSTIKVHGPGRNEAFYIKMLNTGREYPLKRVSGIKTDQDIPASSSNRFILYFEEIPHGEDGFEPFDLVEGGYQGEHNHYWNFGNVHYIQK